MNSVLSYIAGFIVLVLFAALVGPSFVDWNSFRGDIEERLSVMTGWDAQISGDINFVILPAPSFKLSGVRFTRPQDETHVLAQMGTFEGEVALAPLLGGNVDVTQVRIADFTFSVSADEAGRSDWSHLFNTSGGYFGPDSIRLEDMRLERGTFIYQDARRGTAMELTDIEGTFYAASLSGPLRTDLTFQHAGETVHAEIAAGDFGGTRAFPLSTAFTFEDRQARLSFSGIATEFSQSGRIDGSLQATSGVDQAGEPLIKLDAGLVAGPGEATLRALKLSVPGSSFKGDASFNWRRDPRGRVSLQSQSADLGALQAGGGTGDALEALFDRLPARFALAAEVETEGVLFEGRTAKALKARLVRQDGVWELEEAVLDLPHGGRLSLSARQTEMSQGAIRYDSRFELTAPNAQLLASWAAGDGAASANGGAVPLHLVGSAAFTKRLWRFYNLELALGAEEPNLRGGVSFARSARPAIGIEAHGNQIDLSPLAPLQRLLPDVQEETVAAYDINTVISGKTLSYDGWTVSQLDMEASLRDGALAVERFALADESGARLSVSGRLAGVMDEPSGALQGRVDAADPGTTLFGLLDESWQRDTFTPLSVYFEVQGQADEAGSHFATVDLSGRTGESSLTGVLKRRRAAERDAAIYDGVFSLSSEDGAALLSQLGFMPSDSVSGSGELRLQFTGGADAGYETSLRLAANGADASLKGRVTGEPALVPDTFDGRFDVSAPQLEAIVDGLGVREGDAASLMRLLVKNGARGGVLAGGALEREDGLWSFSDVEAVAGTFRLSGAVDWREGGAESLPHLSGAVEVSRLALDPVLSAGVAPGDVWPTAPLDWRALGAFTADVDFKAARMSLADIPVEGVESHIAVQEGVLSVSPFTAMFAESRITLGARFEGGKAEPALDLKLSIEQADMAQASALAFAAPTGQGRLALDMQLEGKGRSWLALVSSLSGAGKFAAEEGHLNGFDLAAFSRGLSALREPDDFAVLKETTLEEGQTPFNRVAAGFEVEEGLLESEPLALAVLASPGASGKIYADIARLRGDVELTLPLTGPENVPALDFMAAGPLRDMRARFDTGAVERFVSRQLLARQMEEAGVEDLPEELEELIGAPPAENDNEAGGERLENAPDAPTPLERPGRAS